MRVLVTGATGFVGGHLVPALAAAGHGVVALVRDVGRYDAPAGVEVVEGDLLVPGTLPPAFDGVEAAYYLVHSMRAGGGFAARDRRAAANFRAAADAAGVARVVYLAGLGEERADLSAHLASRREVERVLAAGASDLTVVRTGIVVGAGSASFEMVRQLAERLPVMVTPRWVRTRCQPIAVDDVVAYLVGVLAVPETAGDTFEIGGPEVMTYERALRRTARLATGREPVVLRVPVLSPGLSAYWVDLVTDVPASVAHPLIRGLTSEVVVHDHRLRRLVPVDPTPFDEAVARALSGADEDATPRGGRPTVRARGR